MGHLPVQIAPSQGLARSPAEKDRATIRTSLKIVQNFIELSEDLQPVIFYSALTRECDLAAAMSAGAQAYLIKPNDLDRIESTIRHLIENNKPGNIEQIEAARGLK